jgi:acyl transferase domain-containing protein/NADP-dependent 3-hydroxy acid dehydrogenase YdfG/acyl carrier protein
MASDRIPQQVPIAIVGIAAFMPGSTSPGGFWRNVLTGRDLMTDVPASRWLIDDYYDPDPRATDKTYGRRGAFLPEVGFDPVRYGIPPNSLPAIDTCQLLALMVAERVIADCAVGLPRDRERVSVLLGVAPLQLLVEASARLDRPVWLKVLREHGLAEAEAQSICDSIAAHFVPWQEETFPGLLSNVVSGRIANKFDLHGANHTTDAACASSLAALYSAVADLSLQRSDLVITGGVDASNDICMYRCFTSTPALSPTGDCRPFSAAADGTMLGEGIVMFALKRIADAQRDGDHVYAVIRGVGASSDGRGTAIYAPLPAGQVRALQRAYESAGYGPQTVELVEAHGTGTSAGDAAEFTALREVFDAAGRPDRQWCALGSVKSQIGHTKAAAGAAGLLKAVLALQQKVLPPTIKVDEPNPALGLQDSPFYLNTAARPWVRPAGEDAHPRRASVSSFGFGGTNFHVTLEEYVPTPGSSATPAPRLPAAPTELILISAPAPGLLLDRARQLDLGRTLTDLARHAQQDFNREDHARLAIVARDADDLAAKLADAAARIEAGQPLAPQGQAHYGAGLPAAGLIGFLFPGQGAQYVGMGADLAVHLPPARAAWDRAAVHELADLPLHRVVFPPPAFSDSGRADADALLTATEWAQPALAVHGVALLAVLSSLGLKPDCVAGHSFGELVALHAAGAFDADTLVRLARRRGELMRDAAAVPGAMLAVTAGQDQAEAAVADLPDVWLANHNAPAQVVFAGTGQALDAVAARLAAEGITAVRLKAATGFHSPLVAPAAEPFADFLRQADIRAPVLDAYAGRDARVYPPDPAEVRRGLAAQIAAPVQFVDVIEAMYARGVRIFVEVGAGTALSGLVGQILGEREHVAVSLDRRGQHAVTSLQDGLGQLAVRGLAIDFAALWEECAPAEESRAEDRSKAAVTIDGGNYGRPYPPKGGFAALPPPNAPVGPQAQAPAPTLAGTSASAIKPTLAGPLQPPTEPSEPPTGNGKAPGWQAAPRPATVRAALSPAAPADGGDGWLRVIGAAQEQAAEAHAEFQRAMTESHLAYLRMAEVTFAGLLSAATGEAPPALPPPALPQQVPPQGAAILPAAPTVAAVAAADKPGASSPSGPTASPAGPHVQAGPMDADSIGALLLEVVAERTGYPVDMLNVDMELDTDLGIDSIKKVEILSAVKERVGDVPGDLAALATLRTLRAIAEQYAQLGSAAGEGPARPAPLDPARPTAGGTVLPLVTPLGQPGSAAGSPAPQVAPVARWAVRAVPAPASGLAILGLTAGPLAVTDDGAGIAPLLVAQLARNGIRAEVVTHVPPDACGVIALDGLRPVASVDEALEVERGVFRAAREIAARMDAGGGVYVTVQDTGGDFGLSGYRSGIGTNGTDPMRAWLGGLAALARTAAKEWPRASVKAIDCATTGRSQAAVADAIVAELLTGGATVDAGLRADGTRITLELAAAPIGQGPPKIGPQSVIVATGGARGVTAAGLRLLARQHRPRLALLGRTPLDSEPDGLSAATDRTELIQLLARRQPGTPAEIAAAAHRVFAVREIRETLSAIEQSGAQTRYYAVDVTDPAALGEALAAVRSDWGPITGIVHGAGVLADALIAGKTDDQFNRVFGTKVEGLRSLLAATADDPLEVLCAFSSVAAQFGNQGQCDYAMANEVLNQVLSAEQARRAGCVVRAIGWGPWQGGMVTSELADRFRDAGVALIDPDDGASAFAAELGSPAHEARVILSAGASARPVASQEALTAQVTVAGPAYAYLADHQVGDAPVVPVATVLDWFAGAARAWRPTATSIAIRDLRVLNKISVPRLADGGHRLIVRGHETAAEEGRALDLDLLGETGQLHYHASVAAASTLTAGTWEAPAGLVPLASPYDGATLFHGPRLQAIRSDPVVGLAGAQCTVVGSRALGWEGSSWQLDPAAVDGGLQLAVLWARQAGAGSTLPMAIRECRVHRPGVVEAEALCVVVAQRADDFSAACDVALIDLDGSPRVELLGVQLVRRPG